MTNKSGEKTTTLPDKSVLELLLTAKRNLQISIYCIVKKQLCNTGAKLKSINWSELLRPQYPQKSGEISCTKPSNLYNSLDDISAPWTIYHLLRWNRIAKPDVLHIINMNMNTGGPRADTLLVPKSAPLIALKCLSVFVGWWCNQLSSHSQLVKGCVWLVLF